MGGQAESSLKRDVCAANPSQDVSNRRLLAPDLPFVYLEDRRLTLAAHVAFWLPGRELLRISASDDRIVGNELHLQ